MVARLIAVTAALLLVFGVANSQDKETPPDVTPDGLVRITDGPFELAYRRPGADFSSYRKIQVRPIAIEYAKTPDLTRAVQKAQRNYRLSDEQRHRVSQAFARSFTRAFTRDGQWKLTTDKGADTLTVRIALANMAVHVPLNKRIRDPEIQVDEAAEVTLVVELRDSITDTPIARGRDTKSVTLASGSYRASDREELRTSIVQVFALSGPINVSEPVPT